jgi:hypothetical protein
VISDKRKNQQHSYNYCISRQLRYINIFDKYRQRAYGGNCEFMIQVRGQLKLKAKTEKLTTTPSSGNESLKFYKHIYFKLNII